MLSRKGGFALCVVLILGAFLPAASASARPQELRARRAASGAPPARVQLGSWRTALEAAKGWNQLERRAGGAMRGLSPRVVHATLPGRGSFYRLWVGPVDRAGVASFCASLRVKHIECIPAPG